MNDALTYVVSRWNEPTETFVRREVAAALRAGERVCVITLKPSGEPDGIVDEEQIEVIHPARRDLAIGLVGSVVRRPLVTARGLVRILRLGRPGTWLPHVYAWLVAHAVARSIPPTAVLVAHFAWVSSTAADHLGRLISRPYVVFVHAYGIYEGRCQDRYLTDRLQRALAVFVESESIAADVRSRHGVEPVVMRMGVPTDFLSEGRSVVPHGDLPLVLSVGALREKKGHDTLIRAIREVERARLLIAGEGPERAKLEFLISDLSLSSRVELVGHQDLESIRQLLDRAAVFALASRPASSGDRDGVPNVLIEAMARGVPVVASSVSGIPDLLDGVGILTPPDNVAALAGALREMLGSSERSAAAARAGLDRVRSDYTTDVNWRRLRRTIDDRLGSTPA